MIASTMCLSVDMPDLDRGSGWAELESLAVAMRAELPAAALAAALHDAQAALLDRCCGPAWRPVRHLPAPFGCPRCGAGEDFARYGVRPRPRRLHTAVGLVELRLANVRCRACNKVFAPLLIVLGLHRKRRTDRLTVDLAELGAQMSFARAGRLSAELAGTDATGGQAHGALADVAAILAPDGTLGAATSTPEVVLLDGTGARAGAKKNGVAVNVAIGLTGRSGPVGRRRARSVLLGLSVDEDWSMMGAQLESVHAPALVVVDGEDAITALARRLWPQAPVQRCWWHLPHGLRKAFYADDAADRHVNPIWARTLSNDLAELLREQIRHEHDTEQALAGWDAFTAGIPDRLTSAHAYLDAARPHAFTCLDPALRNRLAHLGGPELGTGVLERLMRELNARTDIGGSRWSVPGLRDLLTVAVARLLGHPAWHHLRRSTHRPNSITFSLQKLNET